MKHFVLACLVVSFFLGSTSAAFAQTPAALATGDTVHVTLGDLTDNRTTGQFFAGLKVELKLNGDAVFSAYGIGKPEFTVAMDDTGRSLLKDDKNDSMLWDLQSRHQKSDNENVTGELANPSRKATAVKLQGVIPVYAPSRDPAAVVTLPSLTAIFGKTMASKETGISLTVLDKASADAYLKAKAAQKQAATASNMLGAALGSMFSSGVRDNDVQFRVVDPHGLLVKFEIIGPDGKLIENNGRSKMSTDGEDSYTFNFNQPLPKDAGLKIYYATEKSMIRASFSFESVALP